MSFQVQPQAQPLQPVQVYPTTSVTNQQPPSHHSNGSFGTVFIVLAVLLVISLLACFLGRLCSRRGRPESHGGHGHKSFKQQNMNQNHNHNQNHHFQPKEVGDVELGFDKRIPTTKPNGYGPGPGPGYADQGSRPLVYGSGGGGGNIGFSGGEEKDFEMRNVGEGSMREQGHRSGHGLGYGGRGPRPVIYGGGRGHGGVSGEERGFEMKNGGERSLREQGHNWHDAPHKFTL